LLALRDPSRIQSLTLIAAEPLGGEPVQAEGPSPSLLKHFARLNDVDWTDANSARAFLRHIAVLSASPQRGYDRVLTESRIDQELARTADMHAAFNHAAITCDLDRWNLHNIRVPTLVIHGAHDSIVPLANGEAVVRQVQGASLHILPNAGHELHSDDLHTITGLIAVHTKQ
jgi:pimeloyl-ACP methyl ester carboxylesterase